jgi:hypothetical protein
MTALLPLTQLPRRLAVLSGETPPTYHRCYVAIIDGAVPAEKVKNQYFVREDDLPAILNHFGLRARKPAKTAA